MNNWIDVKTQLPDKDGRYLACWGSVFIAKYVKSINKWEREDVSSGLNQVVSHWMSLPQPPQK